MQFWVEEYAEKYNQLDYSAKALIELYLESFFEEKKPRTRISETIDSILEGSETSEQKEFRQIIGQAKKVKEQLGLE